MRIDNFLNNLSYNELVEVRSVLNQLLNKDESANTKASTMLQKLINDLSEIKSRNIVLTMDGMITILENTLDAENKQLKECWETAYQAGRLEGKGIAEEDWQTFKDYYSEINNTEK